MAALPNPLQPKRPGRLPDSAPRVPPRGRAGGIRGAGTPAGGLAGPATPPGLPGDGSQSDRDRGSRGGGRAGDLGLPPEVRLRLRITNDRERLNREIRWRERVIRIFSHRAPAERPVRAVLMELHEGC